MRPLVAIVLGFVIACLLAWLGCALVDGLRTTVPVCTVLWIVALLAWVWWSFGAMLGGRP